MYNRHQKYPNASMSLESRVSTKEPVLSLMQIHRQSPLKLHVC